MATYVLSVGGSTIVPNGEINVLFLKALKKILTRRAAQADRFLIVVGGGGTCRAYQQGLKAVSQNRNKDLDWIGIYTTQLNAQFVRLMLGKLAHPTIITSCRDFDPKSWREPVVVGAGYKPGGSTDTNMILFAKKLGATDVVNVSNVDYLYTADPSAHRGAQRIETISWRDYRKLMGKKWRPGMHVPFDPTASRLAQAAKMRVNLLGSDVRNLDRFLSGRSFRGSLIF